MEQSYYCDARYEDLFDKYKVDVILSKLEKVLPTILFWDLIYIY